MSDFLLVIEDLYKYFQQSAFLWGREKKPIQVINGVDLEISCQETVGLVGESGCGKSTLARIIMGLIPPSKGKIAFKGEEITNLSFSKRKQVYRHMQMVFQDPFSSLNPRMKVGSSIGEALKIQRICGKNEIKERVLEVMNIVGLKPEYYNHYPHELSGGEKQRVCIARAIILAPEFIVADEPTSALDVSIQSQIINLFLDLKEKYKLTCLFISHDLSVVNYMCERVAVMYAGKILEVGTKSHIFDDPLHPYTKSLLSAIPIPDPEKRGRKRIILQGEPPDPSALPKGCPFHPRCPFKIDICAETVPEMKDMGEGRWISCHLY